MTWYSVEGYVFRTRAEAEFYRDYLRGQDGLAYEVQVITKAPFCKSVIIWTDEESGEKVTSEGGLIPGYDPLDEQSDWYISDYENEIAQIKPATHEHHSAIDPNQVHNEEGARSMDAVFDSIEKAYLSSMTKEELDRLGEGAKQAGEVMASLAKPLSDLSVEEEDTPERGASSFGSLMLLLGGVAAVALASVSQRKVPSVSQRKVPVLEDEESLRPEERSVTSRM